MRFIKEYIGHKSIGHLSKNVHKLIKIVARQIDRSWNRLESRFVSYNKPIIEEDQVPPQTIANWFSFDCYRLSRTLDELESACFIERKNDPSNRRNNLICLTDYAKNNKVNIQNAILQVFDKAYINFTETEIQTTTTLLEKIINNLE